MHQIDFLANHPDQLPNLARLFEREWATYYGASGPGDAERDLAGRCRLSQIPIGFVAVDKAGTAIGTAAIALDPATDLSPSIIGLLVEDKHRRRGVATALIAQCEDHARRNGRDALFISTATLGSLLERRGWTKGDQVEFADGQAGRVYRLDL